MVQLRPLNRHSLLPPKPLPQKPLLQLNILGTLSLRCLTYPLPWKPVTLNHGARKLEILSLLAMCLLQLKQIKLLLTTRCKKRVSLPKFFTPLERRASHSVPLWPFLLRVRKISQLLLTGLDPHQLLNLLLLKSKLLLLLPPLNQTKLPLLELLVNAYLLALSLK